VPTTGKLKSLQHFHWAMKHQIGKTSQVSYAMCKKILQCIVTNHQLRFQTEKNARLKANSICAWIFIYDMGKYSLGVRCANFGRKPG